MKELIERLKQLIIEQNNVADKNTIYEVIQVLTSVKSEQPNVIVRDNISEEPSVKFEINQSVNLQSVMIQGNTDNVKGNGLWIDSPSVKSESAEDKKQHAIGFKQYIDDIEMFSLRTLSDEERYNEYINTLNNK